jgi:hypothetical protein
MRLFLAVFAVTVLAFASSSCSGNDESDTEWWEDVVSYVDAGQASEELFVADIESARERFGLSPETACADEPQSDDIYEELSEFSSAIRSFETESFALLEPSEKDAFGFDLCRIERIATERAGAVSAYQPDMNPESTPRLLEDRGYSRTEYAGSEFYSFGDDSNDAAEGLLTAVLGEGTQRADAFHRFFNRVLVDDGVVVRASNDRDIQGAIDARRERADAGDVHVILDSLGAFHAAWLIALPPDAFDLDEIVTRLGGLGLTDEQKQAIRDELVSGYTSWSSLPKFDRTAFAYERTSAGTNEMKVALLYRGEPDQAQVAADELQSRMSGYTQMSSQRPLCEPDSARSDIKSEQGKQVVVVTCTTAEAYTWSDSILGGDALYLAESLPQ